MTIKEVIELVESIQCSNSDKEPVTDLLQDIAVIMLDRIDSWNKPDRNWEDHDVLTPGTLADIQEKFKLINLLSSGMKNAGEFEAGWHLDLKRLSIPVVYHKEAFWVPEWVKVAIDWYRKNDGYAGMKFKKYISKMRPVEEPDEKPWRPAPRNAPPHIRIQGLPPEDEEDEPNYRRKVRDKAPRMKRGMGRI